MKLKLRVSHEGTGQNAARFQGECNVLACGVQTLANAAAAPCSEARPALLDIAHCFKLRSSARPFLACARTQRRCCCGCCGSFLSSGTTLSCGRLRPLRKAGVIMRASILEGQQLHAQIACVCVACGAAEGGANMGGNGSQALCPREWSDTASPRLVEIFRAIAVKKIRINLLFECPDASRKAASCISAGG